LQDRWLSRPAAGPAVQEFALRYLSNGHGALGLFIAQLKFESIPNRRFAERRS
jgi:hypothetical protein